MRRGIAAAIAGDIVSKTAGDKLVHYDTRGYIVMSAMLVVTWMFFYANRNIARKSRRDPAPKPPATRLELPPAPFEAR